MEERKRLWDDVLMEAYFNGHKDPMRQIRDDFFIFFNAMLKEIERHLPAKGLGYRDEKMLVPRSIFEETDGEITTGTEVMVEISATEGFQRLVEEAFEKWQKDREPTQLIDLANLCGMLWFHMTNHFNKKNKI